MADIQLRQFVSQRLRNLRTQTGLTQVEIARRAGVSEDIVGKIERSETTPSLETLNNLCRALRISPSEFLAKETDNEVEVVTDRLCHYLNEKPLEIVEYADELVRNAVTLMEKTVDARA